MPGLYIHVPFCKRKCPYCDFYSVTEHDFGPYADAVCRALDSRAYDTVYFGGGTPSLLPEKYLSQILDRVNISKDAEITIEANPAAGKIPPGFNRVSFGVQSLADAELKALGRLHTAKEAESAILSAKDSGTDNISADIMLGIPGQNLESLKYTLDGLCALPLTHISAYMLKIEENTAFYEGGVDPAGEDLMADLYMFCVEHLARRDFMQYEISNFARGGMVSRHNLNYWTLGEYIGIGPSAHSYALGCSAQGVRFHFPSDLNAFCGAENPFDLVIQDGRGGGFEEYAMLRLRLSSGLDLNEATRLYGIDTAKTANRAAKLENHGLLKIKNGVISLTPQGFLVSNSIIADLL